MPEVMSSSRHQLGATARRKTASGTGIAKSVKQAIVCDNCHTENLVNSPAVSDADTHCSVCGAKL